MPHFASDVVPTVGNPGYQFLTRPLAVQIASKYHGSLPAIPVIMCPCCARAVMEFSFLRRDIPYLQQTYHREDTMIAMLGCAGGCYLTGPHEFIPIGTEWTITTQSEGAFTEWIGWTKDYERGSTVCMADGDPVKDAFAVEKIISRLERMWSSK